LEIIGWIYFQLIEYCTLVLSDSNHLSLLALRQEEGGGTFLGSDDPLTPTSAHFEALTALLPALGYFFPSL